MTAADLRYGRQGGRWTTTSPDHAAETIAMMDQLRAAQLERERASASDPAQLDLFGGAQ